MSHPSLFDWTPPPLPSPARGEAFTSAKKARLLRYRRKKDARPLGLPPADVVREWLTYDQLTGVFVWKKEPRPIGYKLMGKPAGCLKRDGYIDITIPGYRVSRAHRLAWVYVHGDTLGESLIDHKDLNRSNNALCNLRLATPRQQIQNTPVHRDSQSGLKGAFLQKEMGARRNGRKWRVWYSQIKVGDKMIRLGSFYTAEEAHQAYADAARKYFGEFARA